MSVVKKRPWRRTSRKEIDFWAENPWLDPRRDPDNWLYIPEFGVKPEPPFEGFRSCLATSGRYYEIDSAARLLVRASRLKIRLFCNSVHKLEKAWAQHLAEKAEAELDDSFDPFRVPRPPRKERAVSAYFGVIHNLDHAIHASSIREAMWHFALATTSFLSFDMDKEDPMAFSARMSKIAKGFRKIETAVATPEQVKAFAHSIGYPGQIKRAAFLADAAVHFGVSESTVSRRYKAE